MAESNILKMKIQLRHDTAANWKLHEDVVLLAGEFRVGGLQLGDLAVELLVIEDIEVADKVVPLFAAALRRASLP